MGLQIVVYSKLEKMELEEVCLCEDGSPEDITVTSFFSNPLYPSHIGGLESQDFYKCKGKMLTFNAGEANEYLEFKNHLAIIAGYKSLEHALNTKNPGYFLELLRFSNEEGTIGPIISNKLFLDFNDCLPIARKHLLTKIDGRSYWNLYNNWLAGLTCAKEDGAILFA
jgi:hypothetical protein